MKKLFIAAFLVAGITAFAQEQPARPARAENGNRQEMEHLTPEQRQEMQLKKLTKELGLSASQQEQFKKLYAEENENRAAARTQMIENRKKGIHLTDEQMKEWKEKMKTDRASMKDKMTAILTPEQNKKLQEKKERKAERKNERRDEKINAQPMTPVQEN